MNNEKLSYRAGIFIGCLNGKGIQGALLEESFREYLVKVKLISGESGSAICTIYYSPKKNSFKMLVSSKTGNIDVKNIESAWYDEEIVDGYQIFVDGSFINGKIGYGAVILKNGKPVNEISGCVREKSLESMRQIAGETTAVIKAVEWCKKQGINKVTIHYDYEGLYKWPSGIWKTKNEHTALYAHQVRSAGMEIKWKKEAAHTGSRWNEYADRLAKAGAV